jgi:hypothetical protein
LIQQKTEKYDELAHLKIKVSAPLQAIINRCRDNIASPYLAHRIPVRKPPKHLDNEDRTHVTQCLPDFISKQLKKARDKSGYYNDLPVEAKPGFHEIRSLGSKL